MSLVASFYLQDSGLLTQPQRPNPKPCKPAIWFEALPLGFPKEMKRQFSQKFLFSKQDVSKYWHWRPFDFCLFHSFLLEIQLFWLVVSMPNTTWPCDTGACFLLALREKVPWWRWQVAYRCFSENRGYCSKEEVKMTKSRVRGRWKEGLWVGVR